MVDRQRSPFGKLVSTYRRRNKWTQEDLANFAVRKGKDGTYDHISLRTIAEIEKRVEQPSDWINPQPTTVDALARALSIAPNTAAHREFLEAAAITRAKRLPDPPEESSSERADAAPPTAFETPDLDTIAQDSTAAFVAAGRQDHLDRIARSLEDIAAGKPRMVFVSAEAGTGKTWLVSEATRRAVRSHPDLVTLWGNSTGRLGATDPYQPFRQILRTMVGDIVVASPQQLVSGQNRHRVLNRIPMAIDALCQEGAGLMHRLLAPSALDNPNLQRHQSPELAQQVTALSSSAPAATTDEPDLLLSRVLRHYAQAGPTLIVLEDLHWTDANTASVLSRFLEDLHASQAPILVLGTFRPGDLVVHELDEEHPLPPLLRQSGSVFPNHIIDLSTSLDATGGREFVREVSARHGHEINDQELDAIYARTRGLPLVVNGLLSLHDGDVGKFATTAALALKGEAAITPPLEVRSMFEGQLDRLDDDVRNLLTFASVQGNGFSAEILMRAAGISPQEFDTMVNDILVNQQQLVEGAGLSTLGGRRIQEYQFAHALLRDHIYLDQMSEFERSHLHLLTAEAALDLFGENDRDASALIAFHLDRAGEVNRAASAYVMAGDQAFDLSQFDRAWQAYNRVIELDVHRSNPLAEAQALLGLGNCARSLDHSGDAVIWINKAIEISQRRGFTAIQAHALSALGMLDYDGGHVHKGIERLRQAIDLHLEANDLDGASRSMARISYNLHGMGLYDEAAFHARQGIELATQVGNDSHLVSARIALANCLLDLGMFREAIALHEESATIAAKQADAHRVNICLINISLCHLELGEWDAAQDAIDRMMAPGRIVVPRFVGVAWFQSGLIAEGRGHHEEARWCYEQSATIRTGNGQEALLIDSRAGVLRIAVREGDTDTVRELASEISSRAVQHGLDGIEHVALLALTMVEAGRLIGDHDMAGTWLAWGRDYLVTRANRLADPEHRRSYLENIIPHRVLLQMAAAAGFPPPR